MNQPADDIARFFAQVKQPAHSEEFAAAVRRVVKRERVRADCLAACGVVALVAIATLVVLMTPFGSLYPIRQAQDFMMSITGVLACATCAVGLAAWLRSADA